MLSTGVHDVPRAERLVYGRPAGDVLGEAIREAGWRKVFAITTRSVQASELMTTLGAAAGTALAGSYAGIAAHSPIESVLNAADAARSVDADVLLAVGGGSAIDAAKAVQMCLAQDLRTQDELLAHARRGAAGRSESAPHLRIVAVPTTLSAAEFTSIAGVTDVSRGVKHALESPYLVPQLVIMDPRATLYTPERLLLGTGIRAVDHCVEAICSISPTPFGNATAREGLSLLSRGLRALKADPDDLDARLNCQLGAWMAISGPASGVPMGASHAIGRVLGGAYGVPHGETSCVMLAGALTWNAPADDGAQARVIAAMGGGHSSAADAVRALVHELGLPTRLADVGVKLTQFDEIASKSLAMLRVPSTSGNRRPISSTDDVKEILELVA